MSFLKLSLLGLLIASRALTSNASEHHPHLQYAIRSVAPTEVNQYGLDDAVPQFPLKLKKSSGTHNDYLAIFGKRQSVTPSLGTAALCGADSPTLDSVSCSNDGDCESWLLLNTNYSYFVGLNGLSRTLYWPQNNYGANCVLNKCSLAPQLGYGEKCSSYYLD
jgi:hypothetical protein